MHKSEWIKHADIYIDGFYNFSTLEYQIIKALVQNAKTSYYIINYRW